MTVISRPNVPLEPTGSSLAGELNEGQETARQELTRWPAVMSDERVTTTHQEFTHWRVVVREEGRAREGDEFQRKVRSARRTWCGDGAASWPTIGRFAILLCVPVTISDSITRTLQLYVPPKKRDVKRRPAR